VSTGPLPESIDTDLVEKLREREFRQEFLAAETSAKIAEQIIELRKRRDLNQSELAALVGTGQPAISRAERADYDSWSYKALKAIADALDGRLRIIIDAWEDIAHEYEDKNDYVSENRSAHEGNISSGPKLTISVPAPTNTFSMTNDAGQYRTTVM